MTISAAESEERHCGQQQAGATLEVSCHRSVVVFGFRWQRGRRSKFPGLASPLKSGSFCVESVDKFPRQAQGEVIAKIHADGVGLLRSAGMRIHG